MKFTQILLIMTAIGSAAIVTAEDDIGGDTGGDARIGFQIGFASGGDTLTTGVYTDGTSDTIEAGSGLFVGGFVLIPVKNDLYGKVAFNYLEDSLPASNGTLSFGRLPVDLLLVKQFGGLSIGAGMTYHRKIDFVTSIDGESTTYDYNVDDALGFLFEGSYHFKSSAGRGRGRNAFVFGRDGFDLGFRYTYINYDIDYVETSGGITIDSGTAEDIDGSGIAVTVTTRF